MPILEFGFDFELLSTFELVDGRVVTFDAHDENAWQLMKSYFMFDGWSLATVFELAPFHFRSRFWCSKVDQWRLEPEAFGMVRCIQEDGWLYAPTNFELLAKYLERTKCSLYPGLWPLIEPDPTRPDLLNAAEIAKLRIQKRECHRELEALYKRSMQRD